MKHYKNAVIVFLILILISLPLLYFKPELTGKVIYTYKEETNSWDLNSLSYNSNEIEFSDNSLKLKLQVEDNSYTETIENTATVTSATKNGEDQTSKVTAIDNKKVTIYHNNLFLITFNHELNNDNIINLNLEGDQETTISLCNELGESCYVSLNYPSSSGDYRLTLQNLPEARTLFKFNVSNNNVKFNYISATYSEEIFHNITNTSYPSSSSIETDELEISNLDKYGILTKDETLNNQIINYYYSTDSGNIWNEITDFNLSSINENIIKFKIVLNSDGTDTPYLNSLSLQYFTKGCTENWICNAWGSCNETGIQIRTCIDNNLCSEQKIETQNCINYQTRYIIDKSQLVNIKQNTLTEILNEKTKLEILLNNNITNNNITIINYNVSDKILTDKYPAKSFVDISVSEDIKNALQNTILKLYYNDSDIQSINEGSLKIYFFNESSDAWQSIESYVNKEENYVWANLTHFSTYGIFGDKIAQPTQSTSSGGPSGGGSSSSTKNKETTTPQKSSEEIKEIKKTGEQKENKEEVMPADEKSITEEVAEEKSFKNFITGQATHIKTKVTEFAEKNLYYLIIILSIASIYLIYRSLTFFKTKYKKKLIIFDFDGVLADTFNETYEEFNQLAKKYNFTPLKNKDELRDLYKKNIFKSLKKLKINYRLIPQIKKEAQEIADKKIEEVKPFPGIKGVINELKNYKIAIISSNEENIIRKFLEKNNLNNFNLIIDYRIRSKKKKLKKAINYFKLKNKEAVFITDTVGDIKEARKIRLDTIAVTWGYNQKEDFKNLKVKIAEKPEEILRNI